MHRVFRGVESDVPRRPTPLIERTTGSCLCEAITFSVIGEVGPLLHCHCVNCRRASGNFVAALGCDTAELEILDPGALLTWYDLGYCKYGFCKACGSRMFWRGAEHEDRTSIQAGVIDDMTGQELAGVWFAPEAQPHHLVSPDVPHFVENGDL